MNTVSEISNIVQFDDMGYPLLLCIMSDGAQSWIDIGVETARKSIEEGKLQVLSWTKVGDK